MKTLNRIMQLGKLSKVVNENNNKNNKNRNRNRIKDNYSEYMMSSRDQFYIRSL